MGLFDDILEERQAAPQQTVQNNISNGGLFDDILSEQPQPQPTFKDNHPILASTPEALKQFGTRAVKSYPEFGKGVNDAVALLGDKTGLQGLSDFGRRNADFWQEQSDKIQIDPKYQGIKGLSSKETVLPTVLGSIGDQATNIGMALGGGAIGGTVAKAAGLGKVGTGVATFAGTSIPNLAQEGSYLDKIQQFQQINRRIPTAEELKHIQNVALGEKAINTALETVGDKMLFGKVLPSGAASKTFKGISQKALEQAITEATTEGMQESVSIGAENLLGINQGNNLERIADSMAIGGITGGAYGGVGAAMAQPIDTQLPSVENTLNPVEAVQNVSAKIIDGGKVLYDSAADTLNNAAQAISNNLNQQSTFDTLMELSRNGDLSSNNTIEQIAPKTAEKQRKKAAKAENIINNSGEAAATDTGMPNLMADNQNLYNVEQGGENNIVDAATLQEVANEVNQPQAASQAVLEQQPIKEVVKAAAKHKAIEKIRELAPKTVEKAETKSNFVSDNDGVYEKVGENQLRNVDTDEVFTPENMGAYSEWQYDKNELRKPFEFKYNPKAKAGENADNYVLSRPEVVEAYNNYIKSPTVENKEKYEDIYGKYNSEYYKKEKSFKENLEKIAPKTAKKIQKENPASLKGQPIEKTKNLIPFSQDMEIKGKNGKKIKFSDLIKVNNIEDATHHDMKNGGFYRQADENIRVGLDENGDLQHYDISGGVSKKIGEPIYNESTHINNEVESEVGNGSNTETNAGRHAVQNSNEETEGRNRTGEEKQPEVSEVLSGDGQQELRQSDISERGISQKDKETIGKDYKNQHELNKAIEDYINNGEYKKYAGSVRMPQAVKDWLKKYAGAGGLEKQGAEGKGLLSEYYTPKNIVNKMWDLTKQYVNTDGAKVLEPSVGIGRFIENAPENTSFDVYEMNPVSAMITKILYPDANVTTGEFQEKFIDKSKNTPVKSVNPEYDIVIGNPPYGKYNSKYKGMGEGEKYEQLESYFINRSLDTLKDNGILTFIVPSSFLRGQKGKLEIANKCELLDAYRLPNSTFDTTSIGTDIIVLRKKSKGSTENNLFSDKWFDKHPEKILGEVQKGKGNWGTDIVTGDKNAVEKIDTSKSDVKETAATKAVKTPEKSAVRKNRTTTKENTAAQKGKVEYTEYKPEYPVSDTELELFVDTRVDGTLPESKYKPNKYVNQYRGNLYNDFNYLQGNIYEKLDALEYENISEEQRKLQKEKLEKVLPKPKTAMEIRFNPTSDFIQDFELENAEEPRWGRKNSPIIQGFIDYINEIPSADWRDDFNSRNLEAYITGRKIDFRIGFDSKSPEYQREKSKKMSKLKALVEKHFSNYVDKVLDKDTKERLVSEWNKNFNNIYNPDYKKMPFLVKGLNSKFKGSDLKLKETQIEGVNFLTNKGVGLLGFEVGVGKTLTGIIATVQNMQMGRCKRPLIIIPKNIKKNWKEEFAETFPNIKLIDVDNMSKWDGKIEDGTVTLATYQALDNLWYNKSDEELTNMIYKTGHNFNKETTKRGSENVKARFEKMVGKAMKGNKAKFKVEDLGFDHVTFDEAHAGKNLFDEARADSMEKDAGGKSIGTNTYFNMRGGSQSKAALRMFLLTQHILNENNNRNVFMLTATPFNNQSLEVFNMLSYLAKDKLDKMGLYNVYQFNEHYIDVTSDIVLDTNNNPVEKQVELGFKNADTLREIIKSCMLIRTADDANVVRPNKVISRPKLDATDEQLYWFDQADEIAMDKDIDGALFKAIHLKRAATISPDIAANNYDVTPENFIKNSPKLNYIMNCIESMKKKDPKTSQLIYMPIGVKYLDKIKKYLVSKGVYKPEEIEILSSENALSNPEREEERISKITDSFNDREGAVKLIIGTQKIQVGMNLNKNTSTLYMPFVEWNPTDYVQTVGRMWRQGNTYKNVRVVVPLLKNSSDSFMFQKLDEKIKRMNDLMGSDKEYISNDDLQTEEEKIAMISNPAKRAKMYTLLQKDKIDFEIKKLETRHKIVEKYKSNLASTKSDIEYYENQINELEQTEKENGELSPYQKERLRDAKKSLLYKKKALDSINAQIQLDNIDFDGKDSEDSINSQIEKYKEEKEKLNEVEEQKAAEYSVEYDEERRNIKPISEHIKDFEKEYDRLYGETKSDESKPLETEPKKKYEKTRESQYDIPVIKFETQGQKSRKSKTKEKIEKAKNIGDARKYNQALKEGISKWHAEIETRRYDANKTINSFVNLTKNIAKNLGVNDKNLREIMPFLRERTDLPENLAKQRPELQKVWDIVHKKNAAKRITDLADKLAENFDKYYKEYLTVQAKNQDIEDREGVENYVPHEWKKDKNGNFPLLTSAFITKSKHAKQRTIPTYYEGIQGIEQENGEIKTYEPENLDYAALFKRASDNLIKATIDKVFADSVKSYKTEDGANLVLPVNQAPNNWVRIDHHALNKVVGRPVSTKFGEKISPKLQNILSDLGIAIGNRLSKYKSNGMPNSYGKYIQNVPPEIRLQRWFSNKTLAHEIGHGLDDILNLSKDGFVNRHKSELVELNKERIEAFEKQGERNYADSDRELLAELFGVMFNDIESALKYAPAATQEVITRMSNNPKLEKLLPANFDWSEAKHVMEEKVVEFFSEPVAVHPDIASTLKTVFENKKEYLDIQGFKPGQALDELNAIAKMVNFSLSGFHAWALSESQAGNKGLEASKDIFNFKNIYNSLKNGEYDVYKNETVAKEAIKDGLQLGTPIDVDRGTFETLLENTGKWAEKNIKGIGKPFSMATGATSKATELNNKILWDIIHNNYKLSTYQYLIENETRRKGRELTNAEREEIAQWTNDSFGGQVFEKLGISPSAKKAMSRWIMSPDWLISTTRQFMGMFSSEAGHKKLNQLAATSDFWQKVKEATQFIGVNSLTDDITASGARGRIARRFWLRSFIISAIYMNIMNALFRMWDRDKNKDLYPEKASPKDYTMAGNSTGDKLYIFIGRNKDGSEKYLRLGKQFREIPEMIQDPIKHLGNKVAPIPQALITAGTGRSMGGFENKEISKSSGWGRVGFAAKNFGKTFLPYSVTGAIQKGGDFSAFDLIGNTGKGMTKYKAKEEFKNAFNHKNNTKQIADVERSMKLNGFSQKDIKTIKNSAFGQYSKQYKDGYVAALETGDTNKIQKITDKMEKSNVSPIDQRKIYAKALHEYYKSRGIGN